MQVARVVGRATATERHPTLAGWKLMIVQPLLADGGPDGFPLLVVDPLGSRRGDRVMITSDGTSVREMMGANNTPVAWATIGVIDE